MTFLQWATFMNPKIAASSLLSAVPYLVAVHDGRSLDHIDGAGPVTLMPRDPS